MMRVESAITSPSSRTSTGTFVCRVSDMTRGTCQPGRSERRRGGMPFQSRGQRAFSLKGQTPNCHRTGVPTAPPGPGVAPATGNVKPTGRTRWTANSRACYGGHAKVHPASRRSPMPKAKRTADSAPGEKIPRWEVQVDYIETCNCDFACPCNFSGYPTDGFCEALVAYHIKKGRFGKTRLDGLDVIYAAAWPKAIHQGGGTLRLYVSEGATPEQRDALVRIFSGKAKGNGPFELFSGTMATVEQPVFAPVEMTIDGRRSSFRVPGHIEVA